MFAVAVASTSKDAFGVAQEPLSPSRQMGPGGFYLSGFFSKLLASNLNV